MNPAVKKLILEAHRALEEIRAQRARLADAMRQRQHEDTQRYEQLYEQESELVRRIEVLRQLDRIRVEPT